MLGETRSHEEGGRSNQQHHESEAEARHFGFIVVTKKWHTAAYPAAGLQRRLRQPSHKPRLMPVRIAPAIFLRSVMGTKQVL